MKKRKLNVASFCFEAMLSQKFPIYAGGLGVVQAGLLKSAGRKNDWPVNFYGVGIYWKEGYYDQTIGPDGMEVHYIARHYDFLEDTGIKVSVEICGKQNWVKVWRLREEVFKTAPAIFLDTDIEENDFLARTITRRLYTGNEEQRLAQEIVKCVGGIRALEALGIEVDLYQGHESHSVLVATEILRRYLERMSFEEAVEKTRQKFVFTTHTPELVGNEEHDLDLMIRMGCFPGIPREKLITLGGNPFNMTVAGLRLAKKANAVSKLHCQTANAMWQHISNRCPIIPITNGVDLDWQFPEFARASSPEEIRLAKEKYKRELIEFIFQSTGKQLKEEVLTMVWARRFTEYKRPWLIFEMDWPWLENLLRKEKIQLIIAGKPHPDDQRMINTFNLIHRRSLETPGLVVLAGYEYAMSKLLKAGADLWFQCPRRPSEACGTSWMSANLNGALVIFSRDGGILESRNLEYGFPFGVDYKCLTPWEQDALDFKSLVEVLPKAIEMFYNEKEKWYQWALILKRDAEENFNSDRMLKDYIEKLYLA